MQKLNPERTSNSSAGEDAFSVSMAQLLAGDRQDGADWVSSSSSSDDVVPPIRSLSFPNAVLEATIGRDGVALGRPLGRDTSLPVSIQAGFDPSLWSKDQKPASVSTLRQRFVHQTQTELVELPAEEESSEQPDIWAALERQPSPVITLRQRYTQAQEQLQQQLQAQVSAMQPSGSVLELTPEDIVLQEPGVDAVDGAPLELDAGSQQHQAPPPLGIGQVPLGAAMVHQQSGLPPQHDGVSARSVARRQLKKLPTALFSEPSESSQERVDLRSVAQRCLQKLPTAMFSEPVQGRDVGIDKGVRFGSGVPAEDPGVPWQQAPMTLPRGRSSLKQQRSPRGSLRKRSFRRQASSVSFAAVSSASDGSSDSGVSVSGKSKARAGLEGAAGIAAPLVKTVSAVWAMISSGVGAAPAASARSAAYQPARTESRDHDTDLPPAPSARPPRPQPRSGSALWQIASKRAAAAGPPSVADAKSQAAVQRPLSRFWDVVAQAAAAKPSLAGNLGPEHVHMGVKVLLESRQKGSRLDSLRSHLSRKDWDNKPETQQSLAKVMQILSAKQMGKSLSMASTVQVKPVLCIEGPLLRTQHA